jgi:4-methoxybenzoate monooxygenase (O-demethylating)
VLSVLAKRVESFVFRDEPQQRLNNTLRGFDTMPLRVNPV